MHYIINHNTANKNRKKINRRKVASKGAIAHRDFL